MQALPQHHTAESRRVFNHDILSCTHESVSGNHLYSGRALGMTEVDDIIQLHPFLKGEYEFIAAHYERIGLSHTDDVVWDISRKRLTDYSDAEISVFFFGPTENAVRADSQWFRVVEHINCKNNFVALASHLRLEIPHTQSFHGKQWFAGLEHLPYPCYVKAAVSVAGKGIFRCENQQEVLQALARFDEDVPLQVQDEIKASAFLNMQYQATEGGLERLIVTEQLLNGFSHMGNRYPASHEPWEAVDPMAEWLVDKGMRGIFAFDVAVVEEDGDTRYVLIECNPRFNGASYPSAVAAKLNLPAWVARDMHTRHDSLADIDLSGLEFDPQTNTGAVIVNWGTVLAGKLGMLIAGTPDEQQRLEAMLRDRL